VIGAVFRAPIKEIPCIFTYARRFYFHSPTVHLDIIKDFTPTDAQVFLKEVPNSAADIH
jgi:hypothetical protein